MITQHQREVTQLLQQWQGGDTTAMDALMPLVYNELRRLAHRHLQGERAEESRLKGLASLVGRDSSAALRYARNDMSGDGGGFDTFSAK